MDRLANRFDLVQRRFSWGMHFTTNAFLTLVIGNPDDVNESVSSLTFQFTNDTDTVLAVVDLGTTVLTVLVVWLLVLRRRPSAGELARTRRAEAGRSEVAVAS